METSQQNTAGTLSTRNLTLVGGALAAYHGDVTVDIDERGTPTYHLTGLPTDFNARLARGEIKPDLRETMMWVEHAQGLKRTALKQRGGHA